MKLAPDEEICKHCGQVIYIEVGGPWTHETIVGYCPVAEPVEKPLKPISLADFSHPAISKRERDWIAQLVYDIEQLKKENTALRLLMMKEEVK